MPTTIDDVITTPHIIHNNIDFFILSHKTSGFSIRSLSILPSPPFVNLPSFFMVEAENGKNIKHNNKIVVFTGKNEKNSSSMQSENFN